MKIPWPKTPKRRQTGGARAHHVAKMHYEDALSNWPEVMRLSEASREFRKRNHFAEKVDRALREHR